MKRTMSKTPAVFVDGRWSYRRGPIENASYDNELKQAHGRVFVNVSRYNDIQMQRKLRIASQQPLVPILRKKAHFTNAPHN